MHTDKFVYGVRKIEQPVIYGIIAFAGGIIVSFVGYLITLKALKGKSANSVAFASPLRVILYVAYFAALYLCSSTFSIDAIPLFIGGAIGLLLSMALFTKLLTDSIKNNNDAKTSCDSGKVDK